MKFACPGVDRPGMEKANITSLPRKVRVVLTLQFSQALTGSFAYVALLIAASDVGQRSLVGELCDGRFNAVDLRGDFVQRGKSANYPVRAEVRVLRSGIRSGEWAASDVP